MYKLVVVRHGESIWNRENKFTGWTDVDLSDKGIEEAKKAGVLLKENGFVFDMAYTSVLKRAIRTLWHILDSMDIMWIPVKKAWQLNERHYGALQGRNKSETARVHGEHQVLIWRRSYDVRPPAITPDDSRYPGNDVRYANLSRSELPLTECLKDTVNRVLPYWHKYIVPSIKDGKRIIIVAHGNSLRALIKHLDGISDEDIVNLNIPTGIPLVYELDDDIMPVKSYYLGNEVEIKNSINEVANQGIGK